MSTDTMVRIIELWPIWQECHICDTETLSAHGIAVYEDLILPDDYQGEWFGAPCCEHCWPIVARLQGERPGQILSKSQIRFATKKAGIAREGREG